MSMTDKSLETFPCCVQRKVLGLSRVSVAERMVSDSESSSVGKESQFETLYEQDFQALRQECLNTGTLFEDLEFLPREEFLRHRIYNNPKRMASTYGRKRKRRRQQSSQKKPTNIFR